ncbi:MAG: DUF58 domain-containing protein [Saprospiraceae bacterium]
MKLIKNLYLTNLFFYIFGAVIALFVASFVVDFLFPIAQALLVISIAVLVVDLLLVFHPQANVKCKRILPKVFSLNDENPIRLVLYNDYSLPLNLTIIDEIPDQFEERDFVRKLQLAPYQEEEIAYSLVPKSRGEYIFNAVNIFMSSTFGLVERRLVKDLEQALPVYPSIIQMKNFELKAFSRTSTLQGVKRLRRLGHSYEFEQIKNYVRGDDYRSINWKATSRQGKLMVNQYEDEKAQQVYCMIDKSRVMKMPFNGLSLLDYAINTSLVISNVALKKYDRAGLLTFSDKVGTVVKAERNASQINKILQALYREQERHLEANYELLYQASRRVVKGRSLVFLFTNFESLFAAERVLPILRKINNLHLLVVVFFENTEIIDYSEKEVKNVEEIYFQTIAQKFVSEKQQIVQKLRQYGIQAILTSPDELSINTINKYLELKSRGLI